MTLGLGIGLDKNSNPASITPPPPGGVQRILEDGNDRSVENGDLRETE